MNLSIEGNELIIKTTGVLLTCLILSNSISVSSAEGLLGVRSMELGAGKLSPDLTVSTSYDDNLTSATSNEIETFGIEVSPHLLYEIKNNKNLYYIENEFTSMTYEGSGQDDYIDNKFQLGYEYTPTKRTYAGIRGEYFKSHDARGTGQTEGIGALATTPDKWHHYLVEGNGAYGSGKSKGRAELDIGYVSKDYDNHRERTFVRDRDDTYANARFFYRVMPKTSLVMEGRFTNFNYEQDPVRVPRSSVDSSTSSLDSNTYQALLGVTWKSTYKTTGFAKFGYIKKDFDAGERKDSDGFNWNVGIEWQPKTFSRFNFSTSRSYNETDGFGDYVESDTIAASWNHQWHKLSPKLGTTINVSYSDNTYPGSDSGRDDDLLSVGVAIDYRIQRWLNLGGSYRYDDRDSSLSLFGYDRNRFELFATAYF